MEFINRGGLMFAFTNTPLFLIDTMKEFCEICNLKNLTTSPTCPKEQSLTILDVILVSKPKRFIEYLNCECPSSDFHKVIGGATKQYAPFEKPREIYYRSYKNFDDNEFIRDISNVPFHVGEIFDDVNELSRFTGSLFNWCFKWTCPC